MSSVAVSFVVATLVVCVDAKLQRIFLHASCPDVVIDDLRAVAAAHARMDIHVYFSNESSLSMRLFSSARALAAEERRIIAAADGGDNGVSIVSAYVFADCASRLVGFDFSDYLVGMDCGRANVATAMSEIEAFDERRAFSIALERVVYRLDEWHANEACRVWGNDSLRAAFFWALIACAVYALRSHCQCIGRTFARVTGPRHRR